MFTKFLSIALPAALISAQALPPFVLETMYWGWTGPQNNTLTQCRKLTLQWWQIKGTSPPIKAPYTATFFLENYEPYVLDLGVGRPNGIYLEYDWMVDLPTGGPYQSNIVDSNGATAGVSRTGIEERGALEADYVIIRIIRSSSSLAKVHP